jgi:4-amino-4-deoxy-L-arabinose transferase-like glycosyltransferase
MIKDVQRLCQDNTFKLFIILLIAVAIRLININMPILEGTATRQVQTAMIARNFFKHGFNILYPRLDTFGSEPGYYVLEFPLLNFLAALGYRLLGGVHEWVGRLITILFFLGASLFLYGMAKRLFGERVALWSIICFVLSPLSIIFSRAFMPDFAMLCFSLGAIYYLLLFYETERLSKFWLSSLFFMLALLIKPHSFYILFPLAYLIFKKQGWIFLRQFKNWLYLIIAFMPALLWYMHAQRVHTFFSQHAYVHYTLANWFDIRTFLNKDLYKALFEIYSNWMLTPLGLGLFIGSLFLKTKREQNLIWVWLLGALVYTVVFITHMIDPYYNLIMLPVASIFIARMLVSLSDSHWYRNSLLVKSWAKLILWLIIILMVGRYAVYAYIVPAGYKHLLEVGRKIRQISTPDALIIVSIKGGTHALYFCDRKGWGLPLPGRDKAKTEDAIDKFKQYIKEGASYYMTPCVEDFYESIYFKNYMDENYKLLTEETDNYIIYKLK